MGNEQVVSSSIVNFPVAKQLADDFTHNAVYIQFFASMNTLPVAQRISGHRRTRTLFAPFRWLLVLAPFRDGGVSAGFGSVASGMPVILLSLLRNSG